MKIGMNLVLWTLAVRTEHTALLRRLGALGYEGVEITITPGNGEDFAEIGRVLAGEGLRCTTLTNLPPEANPVDPDPAIRRHAAERLDWAIETSRRLGSRILSGPLYAASNCFTGVAPQPEELDRSAAILQTACAAASEAGIALCIEALSRFETHLVNTTSQAVALIGRVGAPNMGLVFDTHHAHLEEDDLFAAITAAGPLLRHVHLSESHRGALGRGLLDWPTVMRALRAIGYDGWLMVEAFGTRVQPLARKAHVWRDVWDSTDQVARDGIAFARDLCGSGT